jgi:hypothetical protein
MTPPDTAQEPAPASFISLLGRIAAATPPEGTRVGAIVDQLDERAFGLLLLLLVLPCLVPGLPGAQVIAIGIFLLAVQLGVGRQEPWLPRWFLKAEVRKGWLDGIARFADKRLRWTEVAARPRWGWLATGAGEKVTGWIMALASVTVMLPITNTIPSVGLTLMAIGLIQRDGLFIAGGILVCFAWIAALTVLVVGLAFGAGFVVEWAEAYLPWLAEALGRPAASRVPLLLRVTA